MRVPGEPSSPKRLPGEPHGAKSSPVDVPGGLAPRLRGAGPGGGVTTGPMTELP
jgi:hypothetical protein